MRMKPGRPSGAGALRIPIRSAVTGTVRPAAAEMFDLHIKAGEARLVQLDGATVDADADLALTGGLREARLAGRLDREVKVLAAA